MVKPNIKTEQKDNNENNISFKKLISYYRFIINTPIKTEKEVIKRRVKRVGYKPNKFKHWVKYPDGWQQIVIKKEKPVYEITETTMKTKSRNIDIDKYVSMFKNISEKLSLKRRTKAYRQRLLKEFAVTNNFFGENPTMDIHKTNQKRIVNIRQQCHKIGMDEKQTEEFILFFENNNLKSKFNKIKMFIEMFKTYYDNDNKLRKAFFPYTKGTLQISRLAEEEDITGWKEQPRKELNLSQLMA